MHFQFRFTGVTIEVVMGLAIKISGRVTVVFILLSTLLADIRCYAETNFAADAEHSYQSTLAHWRQHPTSVTAAVEVAHAAFTWSDFPMRDDPRAEIARRGIEAARDAIAREPTNAAAHYWLALDLGQLARTKSLGALPLVREMA